jgi:hypothetical protein
VDSKEFLALAEQLQLMAGEAAHRTAASRAYYALYNRLHLEISAVTVIPGTGDAHQLVIEHVARCQNQHLQRVATHLGNLRTARIRADYRLATAMKNTDSATSISWGRKAFEILETIPKNDLETQLRAAVR